MIFVLEIVPFMKKSFPSALIYQTEIHEKSKIMIKKSGKAIRSQSINTD